MTDTVTTDKPKNPGRQEWGRKLGKMSKELKLKKQVNEIPAEEVSKYGLNIFKMEYLLGIAAVFIGLGALYYQKKSYETVADNRIVLEGTTKIKPESKFNDF